MLIGKEGGGISVCRIGPTKPANVTKARYTKEAEESMPGKWSLCDHLLSLSDLGGKTSLDSGDGPTRSAVVAGDEVQTVLTLVELGVW